jgi:pimeloyl-ACP methyl ester carboxylesterase
LKKTLRILGWTLLGLVGLVVVLIGAVLVTGLNFKEPAMAKVWAAGFKEKTFTTHGTTINYVEGPDNGLPLMLIHGQMVDWESYQLVLPELSQHFHVFAVDCEGHGKSSKDPSRYNVQDMGMDFEVFIQQVIGKPAIVSGQSSGGLLAVWLAANSPQNVLGVVLEDPPLFSSEYPRIKQTFAWDTGTTAHDFLQQSSVKSYLDYYILYSRMWSYFPQGFQKALLNWDQFYRSIRPDSPVQFFFVPLSVREIFTGLQMYDPHFGVAFYDGSWNKYFEHAEALPKVKCPAVLIHANWYYDKNGILVGAMDANDANRANSLMPNSKLVTVNSGHDVHVENPSVFIKIVIDFGNQLQNIGN